MSNIKLFVIMALIIPVGMQAKVEKIVDRPGQTVYTKGNAHCSYTNQSGRVEYGCNNGKHGYIINGKTSGDYSEAKAAFDQLQCEWCQENNKTDGACAACATQSK